MLDREEYYNNSLILPPECDLLCPYRRCYNKYEDKEAYTQGQGYSKEFRPICATRQASGCPPWRNEVDDEANLPRALEAAVNLIRMHITARTKLGRNNRDLGFEIIHAVARLLHKRSKA